MLQSTVDYILLRSIIICEQSKYYLIMITKLHSPIRFLQACVQGKKSGKVSYQSLEICLNCSRLKDFRKSNNLCTIR